MPDADECGGGAGAPPSAAAADTAGAGGGAAAAAAAAAGAAAPAASFADLLISASAISPEEAKVPAGKKTHVHEV